MGEQRKRLLKKQVQLIELLVRGTKEDEAIKQLKVSQSLLNLWRRLEKGGCTGNRPTVNN